MTGQVRALDYLKECRGGGGLRAQPGLTRRERNAGVSGKAWSALEHEGRTRGHA